MTTVRPGIRLHRLELLNWGPFDRRVWQLHTRGEQTLLTGDLGSGSAAVVDALTALIPADGPGPDLLPRVRGHWRSAREETTGALRPVALRPGTTWSALLAVFTDAEHGTVHTAGRVFWLRGGSTGAPQEFGLVADADLTIAGDLSAFGGDPRDLARRLEARDDVVVCTDLVEYTRHVRTRLGLGAEAARLFTAAASPAPIGDLDTVVARHVLDPADAGPWVERLAGSVEDLTATHETLASVRAQLTALDPLLTDADSLTRLTEQLSDTDEELLALPDWADRWRERLLSARATRLRADVASLDRELTDLLERLDEARDRAQAASTERAGRGGDQLTRLETRIRDLTGQRRERRGRSDILDRLLETVGLDRVTDEHAFRTRREEVAVTATGARQRAADTARRVGELDVVLAGLSQRLVTAEADLAAVRAGSDAVPPALSTRRDALADELGVPVSELPFAGELLSVPDRGWLPAAVAVLGELPGSLLVPARHAAAVADLPLAHHVLPAILPTTAPLPPARSLAAAVQVADSPVGAWLETEIARRAPHVRVEDEVEFDRLPLAVDRVGRVRDATGRLPARTPDPDSVLGWTSTARAGALAAGVTELQARSEAARTERAGVVTEHAAAVARDRDLARVDLFALWRDVDWRSSVEAIAEAKEQLATLARRPIALARLDEALADLRMDVAKLEAAQADALQRRGTASGARDEAFRALGVVRRRLGVTDEPAATPFPDHAASLLGIGVDPTPAQRLDRRAGVAYSPPVDLDDVDERERQLRAALGSEHARRADAHAGVAQQVVTGMTSFLLAHPDRLPGLAASVASIADVRALRDRLRRVELPTTMSVFTEQLADRAVRDAASLLAELDRRSDRVHQRVRAIDEVLHDLDGTSGRRLHLIIRPRTSTEVETFRAELRACADAVGTRIGADEDTTELVDRLTGLAHRLTADPDWARRVTDVATWWVVTASEHWIADGTEVRASTRPGDRGRREETLAATVLLAAAVHAREEDGLRLLVVDQYSAGGSPRSVEATRATLELGDRLGLQVLVVAPRHEIAPLEPHLGAVGQLVDPDGNDARLRCVTLGAAGT